MKKPFLFILFLSTILLAACSTTSEKNNADQVKIFTATEFGKEGFKSGKPVKIKITSVSCYNNSCALNPEEEVSLTLNQEDSKHFLPFAGQMVDMIIEAEPENCGEEKETCNQVKNVSIAENNTTPGNAEKSDSSFVIPEAKVEIILPDTYQLTKNFELNRRGSFASYDFKTEKKDLPVFQEIQFFSEESIEEFNEKCKIEKPCFMGDYPTLERYESQQKTFYEGSDYTLKPDFALGVTPVGKKEFNGRPYLVSNIPCTGDSCVIREYTTFIGEVKVDIWIMMKDETQTEEADKLFTENDVISLPFTATQQKEIN